jgi:hypothetical protein
MSEVLVEFDSPTVGKDGTRWTPRVCGRVADDGLWEGWIEFHPAEAGRPPIRSGRETEQPNRADLLYWAEGLSDVYLEGALGRALKEHPPRLARKQVAASPAFEGPAPRGEPVADAPPAAHPVLDPFEVYQQGEDILLEQLGALSPGRLRDIVVAYGFAAVSDANGAGREKLTALIVAGVRRPFGEVHGDAGPEAKA